AQERAATGRASLLFLPIRADGGATLSLPVDMPGEAKAPPRALPDSVLTTPMPAAKKEAEKNRVEQTGPEAGKVRATLGAPYLGPPQRGHRPARAAAADRHPRRASPAPGLRP